MELYRNQYLSIHLRNDYYSIEFPEPQVIVLPIVEREQVLMIRAKRPVIKDVNLELPAGNAFDGESLEECALRELREETGISVEDSARLKPLPKLNPMPSRMPQFISSFQIDLSMREFNDRIEHDNEVEGVELVSFDDFDRLVLKEKIFVSSHIALFHAYLAGLDGGAGKNKKIRRK